MAEDRSSNYEMLTDALTSYEQGNCSGVLDIVSEIAGNGEPAAQALMGKFFVEGLCVKQDYVKAREWLEKGSEKGNRNAMFHLGNLYYDGRGVGIDVNQAESYWDKSALMGHPQAQLNLGYLYSSEKHAKLDYKLAVHWLALAVNQKEPEAMFQLGRMYVNGHGVKRNNRVAMTLWKGAAKLGHEKSIELLRKIEELR